LKIFNCFCTDSSHSGNPAGVIFNFSGDKTEKQKLAQKRQLPVIVFADQVDSDIPILQFFYLNVETNLCLHGALAAVFLLMNQRRADHITVSNGVWTIKSTVFTFTRQSQLIRCYYRLEHLIRKPNRFEYSVWIK
jgi:predicted PhzF superfamily epimerase YddE/YHI9